MKAAARLPPRWVSRALPWGRALCDRHNVVVSCSRSGMSRLSASYTRRHGRGLRPEAPELAEVWEDEGDSGSPTTGDGSSSPPTGSGPLAAGSGATCLDPVGEHPPWAVASDGGRVVLRREVMLGVVRCGLRSAWWYLRLRQTKPAMSAAASWLRLLVRRGWPTGRFCVGLWERGQAAGLPVVGLCDHGRPLHRFWRPHA